LSVGIATSRRRIIYLGAELLKAKDLGAVDAELVVWLHNGKTTGGY
jgi:hypothetical protein